MTSSRTMAFSTIIVEWGVLGRFCIVTCSSFTEFEGNKHVLITQLLDSSPDDFKDLGFLHYKNMLVFHTSSEASTCPNRKTFKYTPFNINDPEWERSMSSED